MTPGRRWVTVGLVALFSACGVVEEASEEGADPAPAVGDAADAEPPTSDGQGSLTVSGPAIESPGTYDLDINCQYSRSPGILIVTAYGTPAAPAPGTLNLNVGGPMGGVPFEDGTYPGRFSYDESLADGRILTYTGEVETAMQISRGGEMPTVEFQTRGATHEVELELSGRCAVMGAG